MQKKTGPLQLCMSRRHVNAQVFPAQLPTAGQTSASQAEQRATQRASYYTLLGREGPGEEHPTHFPK